MYGTSRRRARRDAIQFKFARHVINQLGGDGLLLIDVGIDQRMFAEYVNHARDSAGIVADAFDAFRRKDWFAVRSGEVKAPHDVTTRCRLRAGATPAAQ